MSQRCMWCGQDLEDGREVSGWTGEGPDWMVDGDFGCDESPIHNEGGEVQGNHHTIGQVIEALEAYDDARAEAAS